jgi:hypothetical protein
VVTVAGDRVSSTSPLKVIRADVPAITLSKAAAAAALDMSVDSFDRYVVAHVRCVRRGKLRLFPVAELERWARENAEHLLASPDRPA